MFKDKLKSLIKTDNEKSGGNNKKKIENLIFLLIVLVITIFVMNYILNDDSSKSSIDDTNQTNSSNKELASSIDDYDVEIDDISLSSDLETKLESILSNISGVGEAKVLLNYSSSSQTIPMYDETTKESITQEEDTEGGTRSITETDTSKEIIYEETDSGKSPITSITYNAAIEGAIITANRCSVIAMLKVILLLL